MVTLMSWRNSEGTKGRCDDKCHNARKPNCDCMCGGRFHGRGADLQTAIAEFWDETVKNAEARAKAEGLTLETRGFQLALFQAPESEKQGDSNIAAPPAIVEPRPS